MIADDETKCIEEMAERLGDQLLDIKLLLDSIFAEHRNIADILKNQMNDIEYELRNCGYIQDKKNKYNHNREISTKLELKRECQNVSPKVALMNFAKQSHRIFDKFVKEVKIFFEKNVFRKNCNNSSNYKLSTNLSKVFY